jgi:predicted RNA-binding protein
VEPAKVFRQVQRDDDLPTLVFYKRKKKYGRALVQEGARLVTFKDRKTSETKSVHFIWISNLF